MKTTRALGAFFASIIAVSAAIAQSGYTNVSATMSACYANGSVTASWVNQSGSGNLPLLNGSTFAQQVPSNIDSVAKWTLRLADVNQINVTPSQWKITACAKGGSQPSCYTQTLTITGNTQDVSSSFTAAPVPSGCTLSVGSVTGSTGNGLVVTAAPPNGNVVIGAGPDSSHVIPINTGTAADYLGQDGTYHDYTALIPSNLFGVQTVQFNGTNLPKETKLNILSPLTAVDNSGNASSDVGLSNSGVVPGTYTNPTITVDTYGRTTMASSAGSYTPTITTGSAITSGTCSIAGRDSSADITCNISSSTTGTLFTVTFGKSGGYNPILRCVVQPENALVVQHGPTAYYSYATTTWSFVATSAPSSSGVYQYSMVCQQ